MEKKHKFTCASFSLLFLTLAAVLLKEKNHILPFAALGYLTATFFLMPRRTVIAFSLSTVSAIFMLLFLAGGPKVWLISSISMTLTLICLRLLDRLPDFRPTTDMWVGSLILMESMAVLFCLI